MINLVNDTIDKNDIDSLILWLKTYPRLTKGPITKDLEQKFADQNNSKYSVFCNSGSSANLLMLQAILESKVVPNGFSDPIIGFNCLKSPKFSPPKYNSNLFEKTRVNCIFSRP